jgi:nucleoside 2-deoxyribosyltransferase
MKTIYVAGPMRGYHQCNFAAFDEARDILNLIGFTAISPADHDREIGFDYSKPETVDPDAVFPMKEVILWDLQQVAECDYIFMLKGWENSVGANLEFSLAKFLGKKIMYDTGAVIRA